MIHINEIIPKGCVLIRNTASDKKAVIRQLIGLLDTQGCVVNKEMLYQDVIERENLTSTGIGNGCGIPHAHSDAVTHTVLAVACLNPAISFDSIDEIPVRIVFLLAGPKSCTGMHLKILSKMARLLHGQDYCNALAQAESEDSFREILKIRDD